MNLLLDGGYYCTVMADGTTFAMAFGASLLGALVVLAFASWRSRHGR